jgi:Family of unknown function (DUF695)
VLSVCKPSVQYCYLLISNSCMAWRHYTCEISGKTASVLIDDRFAQHIPVKDLIRLSWISVYCNQPTCGALWNPEETDSLDRIEHDLIRLAEIFGRGWAVYVLRIATPGIREYYLYEADQAELTKAFIALKVKYRDYRMEFETITDRKWEQYQRYVFHQHGDTGA